MPAKKKATPKATGARAKTTTRGARQATSAGSAKQASQVERAAALHTRLAKAIPSARCELVHQSPWQLLVATILSAQSTDRMVNKVTPVLFARWPTPALLADASQEAVEEVVKPTGFFRNKAKAIREASRLLVERHRGEVPRTLEELVELPGVARKTANVVLGVAYGIPSGITVDTHAGRVARRLGLTKEEDPAKVEAALCGLFPREEWIDLSHRFVLHGRYVCLARGPKCTSCPLNELCPSSESEAEGTVDTRAAGEKAIVEAGAANAGLPPL